MYEMSDSNYWKDKYSQYWKESSKRENLVKEIIEKETREQVIHKGLGAGTTKYINGSAAKQGLKKGEADLLIPDKKIAVEVTGPTTTAVRGSSPLWVRPDKIDNASSKHPEIETWVAHFLPREDIIRAIKFDDTFYDKYENGKFEIVTPYINGAREKYVAIPANDESVTSFDELIERIKEK
jgi:hypothetical protein